MPLTKIVFQNQTLKNLAKADLGHSLLLKKSNQFENIELIDLAAA